MTKEVITTENGAGPTGAYSAGLRAGDFIFVSGQGPLDLEIDAIAHAGDQKR